MGGLDGAYVFMFVCECVCDVCGVWEDLCTCVVSLEDMYAWCVCIVCGYMCSVWKCVFMCVV